MWVNVCLNDAFWTTEHFVTKLGMVVQHHEPECHVEKQLGVMKVVRSQSGICQKPLLASSLLKILLCPSLARLWLTENIGWTSLCTALLRCVRSTQMGTAPLGLVQPLFLSTIWLAQWQVRRPLVSACFPVLPWPWVSEDGQSSSVCRCRLDQHHSVWWSYMRCWSLPGQRRALGTCLWSQVRTSWPLHLCAWRCQALHMPTCWEVSMAGCRGCRLSLLLSCHNSPISLKSIRWGQDGSTWAMQNLFRWLEWLFLEPRFTAADDGRWKHQCLTWTLLGVN